MTAATGRTRSARCVAAILIGAGCVSCQQPAERADRPGLAATPVEHAGIHNLHEVTPGVWSGSIPEGDAGFDTLKAMGIQTVIAVDATSPQLERIRARGMRSIHLPIKYSGIEPDTQIALARAVRDAQGPIYIHCHHGKHRGPAAAATAAVALGKITGAEGQEFLKFAGTSPNYPGLFDCVAEADEIDAASIDAWDGTLVEMREVGGVAGAMAGIDDHFALLDHLAERAWATDPKHPDRTAVSEAGALHDLFRRAAEESDAKAAAYAGQMHEAVRIAESLEVALRAGEADAAQDAITVLGDSCSACHTAHRVKRQW